MYVVFEGVSDVLMNVLVVELRVEMCDERPSGRTEGGDV
jgi:hypothetical protein